MYGRTDSARFLPRIPQALPTYDASSSACTRGSRENSPPSQEADLPNVAHSSRPNRAATPGVRPAESWTKHSSGEHMSTPGRREARTSEPGGNSTEHV